MSVIVWLGGMIFETAVAIPALRGEGDEARAALRVLNRRFITVMWLSMWTMLVTGFLLMIRDPRFFWFSYDDRWNLLLGLKQIIFILIAAAAFSYVRMIRYLDSPTSNGGFNERAEIYRRRVGQYRAVNLFLGLVAVLLAIAM